MKLRILKSELERVKRGYKRGVRLLMKREKIGIIIFEGMIGRNY